MARVQKTRGGPFGTLPKTGRAAAVAGRILASHNRTIPSPFGFSEAPAIRAQPCATDQIAKRRAALLQTKKAAASNFAPPAQVDTMRQTVLALAICGASALQPARNARRQSLAVRQAPRGVRQRAVRFKKLRSSTPSRLPTCMPSPRRTTRCHAIALTARHDAGRRRLRRVRHVLLHDDGEAGLVRLVGQGPKREM